MQRRLNMGHTLSMANFYNNVDLPTNVFANGTCRGTLRAERKFTPHEVCKTKLNVGEVACINNNTGITVRITVRKWWDKNDVQFITTQFEFNM